MSSESITQLVLAIQQNDYASLVILTAVIYDYILTFSSEIKYIWGKPWTRVSTLFALVRYAGIYSIIIDSLGVRIFSIRRITIKDTADLDLFNSCSITGLIGGWSSVLFLGAADFAMILRVWAMYDRSRLILVTLLSLFFVEVIVFVITAAIHSVPRNHSVDVIQLPGFSVCSPVTRPPIWSKMFYIVHMIHGGAICTLAVVQFMNQLLQLRRLTMRWHTNRYMTLLIKQGIVYFLLVFVFSIGNVLFYWDVVPAQGWRFILMIILSYVPIFTLTPRFIISIRALYARDVEGRRGSGIDTGFGLSAGCDVAGADIIFLDVVQNEGPGGNTEEMPMEAMET